MKDDEHGRIERNRLLYAVTQQKEGNIVDEL